MIKNVLWKREEVGGRGKHLCTVKTPVDWATWIVRFCNTPHYQVSSRPVQEITGPREEYTV